MREDYLILSSAHGGPVSLSGISYKDDVLTVFFESGNPGMSYEASDMIINGQQSEKSRPLFEYDKGKLRLDADLRQSPHYDDGFENYYEVVLKLVPKMQNPTQGTLQPEGALHNDSLRGNDSFKSGSMLLSWSSSGIVSFVYDIEKREAFSIAFNGKNLSQERTAEWNRDNKNRQSTSSLEELLFQLDSLPGLDEVKTEIRSSINVNRLQKIRRDRGFCAIDMSLHMVFMGNPGTGKTTLARLLAKIYKEAGILSKGQFVEADRSTLVSHYIGGTAVKTGKVIDSAIGGILFIDEAYSLADGQDGKDYGREAIATLLKRMEDRRDDLIVIVAGYPEKMEKFLNSNPGFRSRFNHFIRFRDYSPEELTDIFLYECRRYSLVLENDIPCILISYFRKLIQEKDPYFANGRTVRNLFEQTLVNQANRFEGRYDIRDRELMQIKKEDLPECIF